MVYNERQPVVWDGLGLGIPGTEGSILTGSVHLVAVLLRFACKTARKVLRILQVFASSPSTGFKRLSTMLFGST